MMDLIQYCRDHTIAQILSRPMCRSAWRCYRDHAAWAKEQILQCATQIGNLVVLDLRPEDHHLGHQPLHDLTRCFLTANISIHVMWGLQKQNTVLAVGKSILDRSSKTHVGNLMPRVRRWGHAAAGTRQPTNDKADGMLQMLVQRINADG